MIQIGTFQNTSSRYIFNIDLNGESFRLRFHWNTRENNWYMDIMDTEDNNLLLGVKLVVDYELTKRYKYIQGLPKGEFFVTAIAENESEELTYDNFGSKYIMVFLTNEEFYG